MVNRTMTQPRRLKQNWLLRPVPAGTLRTCGCHASILIMILRPRAIRALRRDLEMCGQQ